MKTERRHELQTNTLADQLAHAIEAAKPYSRAITGVAVIISVLALAYAYISNRSSQQLTTGWDQYFHDSLYFLDLRSMDRDKLSELAESPQYAGTPVHFWANLTLADLQLTEGTSRLFTDKEEAKGRLDKARDSYKTVLDSNVQLDPLLRQRAMFGLARALESKGMLKEAIERYHALAKDFPNGPFAAAASRREKELSQGPSKSFYDWFDGYSPTAKLSSEPGLPGKRPSVDDMFQPKAKLPSIVGDKLLLPEAASDEPDGKPVPRPQDNDQASPPESDQPAPGESTPDQPQSDPAAAPDKTSDGAR